ATAFAVSQDELIRPVVFATAAQVARTFQTSVRDVEELTGLDFGALGDADVGSVDSFAVGAPARAARELGALEDIRLPGAAPAGVSGAPPAFAAAAGRPGTEPVPGTGLSYYFLAFDADGPEPT